MALVFLPDTLLSFSVVVPAFSIDNATCKLLFVPGPETIHIGPYPHCGHDSLSPAHESIEGLLIPFSVAEAELSIWLFLSSSRYKHKSLSSKLSLTSSCCFPSNC